jgi:RNA polymerase sigma-70 factor (ECF subfamily)
MEAQLRPVPASNAEEADLADPTRSFEDFYEATYRRLYTALCLVTGNRHEAEDIMQETFLRVFERWERISGVDDLDGYLYRSAMNVFRNRYRRTLLAVQRTLALKDAADDLAAIDTRDEIVRLLRGLTPRERAAIVLTSILDLTADDAGRMLGIKASTIRVLSSRARAHMKDEVDPR